ncbi:hypothetical protein BDQ12DRAFT_667087 [Crucibulum laeve]|uniref:Uncharacterized protein n=1 Tax=Crucibulum laeve TaxID=68775 RepID=A0A5C3LXM9_9AGAR|nr:hypothetical protein BDQ12DRAFT_667087 [Crucibulum laeve]
MCKDYPECKQSRYPSLRVVVEVYINRAVSIVKINEEDEASHPSIPRWKDAENRFEEEKKLDEAAISRYSSVAMMSVFLSSLCAALLSYAHDTYADRNGTIEHKTTDDVTTALWFISLFYAVIAALLGRKGVTDKLANIIMDMSFCSLVIGGFVFIWAEKPLGVAIPFTIAIGIVLILYPIVAYRAPENVM